MDWFLLSYHSIGSLTLTVLLTVTITFLLLKKEKSPASWYLISFFIGNLAVAGGYFISYAVFDPFGAYHRYSTVAIVFGQAGLIRFAYLYPRNIHPKESRFMIYVALPIALITWLHFIFNTWGMEKIYKFDAHCFTFDFGRESGAVIASFFLLLIVIFLRKTIAFSEYNGRFRDSTDTNEKFSLSYLKSLPVRFLVGVMKVFHPVGKDAKATRTFAIALILLFTGGIANLMSKTGSISYEAYAYYMATSNMFTLFALVVGYLNTSPEPTTFMVKLVAISLVTLLLTFGTVANITLTLSDNAYDGARIEEIDRLKKSIIENDFDSLPGSIEYVIARPAYGGLFSDSYEKLYAKDPDFTTEAVLSGEKKDFALALHDKIEAVKKKNKNISMAEAEKIASTEITQKEPPMMSRLYRNAGKFFVHYDFKKGNKRYEIGYSYQQYRVYTHKTAIKLFYVIIGSSIAILLLFPVFFNSSLVKPLNDLLKGVTKVNLGDLTVKVPIKVQDEIGFLSSSFNSMVESIREARRELQDYAENLEDKVKLRTKEVQEKMEEVHALKVQQDGDYYLTSLLTKPLFYNANKSGNVKTEFIIKQKKSFEFRSKKADLGGDLCITGNLKFGTSDNFKRYTMAMNGDAMGKSMQGAGGSLVMGVVMNSIMARSAGNKRILGSSPEQWLTDIYNEIHGVFKSFNGSMVISCVVSIIDDETGEMRYFNAEHPYSVLYRDGKASFIEDDLKLRKLGLDSEIEFQVYKFQLMPGDAVILASDGRDDLDLTPNESVRTINHDETLFLKRVEEGKGDISEIEKRIKETGVITDDLSLLRIGFKEEIDDNEKPEPKGDNEAEETVLIDLDSEENVDSYYQEGKKLLKAGETEKALKVLSEGYAKSRSNLRLNKLLGLLSFKGKDYVTAVDVLGRYLEYDSDLTDFWFYLSIAEKKLGKYQSSLDAATKLKSIQPENVQNLVNMADLYRLLGNRGEAQFYSDEAYKLDPENKNLKKLIELLKT
ncbi:MAG: SpoIIE family protein phosphatase [Leptospira sp.]|nr:SpoIIE family protein phosphatase [Leptospira sp.]